MNLSHLATGRTNPSCKVLLFLLSFILVVSPGGRLPDAKAQAGSGSGSQAAMQSGGQSALPARSTGTDRKSSANESKAETPATGGEPKLFDTTDPSFISKYLPPGSYMSLNDVKPGMTGYGLSVFQGTSIEKFDVQVIGVMKKAFAGRDALLVKLGGAAMEKNNVIRGMSGSPVYINGKLVGAVSFGFDFSKEPIAGVTAITDMLDALADSGSKTPIARLNQESLTVPWNPVVPAAAGTHKLVNLLAPLSLSGFSSRAEQFLGDKFKDTGITVGSGLAGGVNPGAAAGLSPPQIKPGSAASVLLSTGDFVTAATGTVTARFGPRVIGFGHPFLSAGTVEFPIATAVIHKVLPSLWISMKLSSPVEEVGSLLADRPWGIGFRMGKTPHMIPCSYTVIDRSRNLKRTYNCKIVDHPDITPALLTATVMSAIDYTHQNAGPYVARVESKFEAEGMSPLTRVDCFGSNLHRQQSFFESLFAFFMGDTVSGYVYRTSSSLLHNQFQKAALKSCELKVVLEDEHSTASIERVYVEKSQAAPGEQVSVMCVVRPYNHEPRIETLSFQVPRDAPDGSLVIGVAGGDQIDFVRHRMGISDPEPDSLEAVANQIRRQGRGDEISLVVAIPDQALLVNGTKIYDPPSHWAKVLFSNKHTRGPQIIKGEIHSSKATPWLISDSHILTVEVKSKDKATARPTPALISSHTTGENPAMTEAAKKALGSSAGTGRLRGASGTPLLIGVVGQLVAQSRGSQTSSSSSSKSAPTATGLFSPKAKGYPHMRLHQIWRQETEEDFHDGRCEGATVDSWGRVGPGFDNTNTVPVAANTNIWSGTWANGHFYYSTNDEVFRWAPGAAKPEKVAKLETTLIPALASDSTGCIYAACVPQGEVYALPPGGAARMIYRCPDSVLTTLCVDDQDNLYVGTAGNGRIYKLDRERKPTMLFDSGQAHVTALFYCRQDGKLYVGTGEKGAVYSIDSTGKAQALYQSPERIVTGVARNKRGDLFVATAAQGRLVRISPAGEIQSLASSEAFYTLHYNPANDAVFSGDAEGDITMACLDKITQQPYFMPVCRTEQEAVMALCSNDQILFSGSSNLAMLKAFTIAPARSPYYNSLVKDAGRTAAWVRLRASGAFTEADSRLHEFISVETRTGETSTADGTWSSWRTARFDGESYVIASPPGRFLQYRLTWNGSTEGSSTKQAGPQVGRVDVIYMPTDQSPDFSSISLKPGAAVSGKPEISVTATDADGDNILCSIEISGDNGKTWSPLVSDLRSKESRKESSSSGKKGSKSDTKPDSKSGTKSDTKSGTKSEPKSDTKPATKSNTKPGTKSDGRDSSETGSKEIASTPLAGAGKPRFVWNFPAGALKRNGPSIHSDAGRRPVQGTDPWGAPDSGDDDGSKKEDGPDEGNGAGEDKGEEPKDGDAKAEDPKEDGQGGDKNKEKDKKDDSSRKKKKSKSKDSAGDSSSSSPMGSSKGDAGGASTETFTWQWDTTKQREGSYILRFTIDDRLSNPDDNLIMTNVRAVTVDNTNPEIKSISFKRTGQDTADCLVTAADSISAIANATYKVDDGEWFAFAAQGNTLDGLTSTLEAKSIPCGGGSHKIEVKVSDRAGNTATKSATLK